MTTETLYNDSDDMPEMEQSSLDRFCEDVVEGLISEPKYLDSKYFYDTAGDHLFQQIMACPEYYLTNCELEIFEQQTEALAKAIMPDDKPFDLIELGAGDATKSTFLLSHLLHIGADFTYQPIDISANVIALLDARLASELPGLKFKGLNGEYFEMLQKASASSPRRKVVLFLGSNIGNMPLDQVEDFCMELRDNLASGDILLIGFDLKKNPRTILDAYNDAQGITRNFNLNLLHRINNELNADFNLAQFDHFPMYNPETGECKSYLVSLAEQTVNIGLANQQITFKRDEYINMEISLKFSEGQISELAAAAGFKPLQSFFDSRHWFTDAIWVAR